MTTANKKSANVTVKEKRFFILEFDKKNKNHRIYPKSIGEKWLISDKAKNGEGFDVEYSVEDGDYEYEFLKEEDVCGVVSNLTLEGNKLFGVAKFKVDGPYADKINKEAGFLETLCIVPKGKGAVKNQIIQDDYELYGFSLILSSESSFIDEPVAVEKAEA